MSLESEIKNLTAAMTRLAEGVEKLLTLGQVAPSVERSVNHNMNGASVGYIEMPSDEPMEMKPIPAIDKQALAAAAKPLQQTAAAAPTFDDAKKAFLAIAQKYGAVDGTAKSREVLSRYGAVKLKDVREELYGEFIALCGEVVAGGEA